MKTSKFNKGDTVYVVFSGRSANTFKATVTEVEDDKVKTRVIDKGTEYPYYFRKDGSAITAGPVKVLTEEEHRRRNDYSVSEDGKVVTIDVKARSNG